METPRRVLLVDWPSRDLPESLARAGFAVASQEGPDTYVTYAASGDDVERRNAEAPNRIDILYAYRPFDELPEIVDLASRLQAQILYWETGPEPASAEELSRAREIVESAGIEFRAGRPEPSAA
jgi:predicted CoA-binding protein